MPSKQYELQIRAGEVTIDSIELTHWINSLIEHGNLKSFYNSALWKHLRQEVLDEQHYECQVCRARGIYEEATTVHHIKYVRRYPELALTKDNLLAVCKECHYNIHHKIEHKPQLNVERW